MDGCHDVIDLKSADVAFMVGVAPKDYITRLCNHGVAAR